MPSLISAGLDGSEESHAAARWAAREAVRRDAVLQLVRVRELGAYPPSPVVDDEGELRRSEQEMRELLLDLSRRHPGLQTKARQVAGVAVTELTEITHRSALLVLGSRGLGRAMGFLVGSVALPTVAHARCPVVMVRATAEEDTPPETGPDAGPVVLGLKLSEPAAEATSFAFAHARRCSVPLRAVHAWMLPPVYTDHPGGDRQPPGLTNEKLHAMREILRPWQERYPSVDVEYLAPTEQPARRLVEAAEGGSLLVVARRARRPRFGLRVGTVTQTAMQHARLPVAVVPENAA
jgi:nucleotide-binding universal stress UspA family protein